MRRFIAEATAIATTFILAAAIGASAATLTPTVDVIDEQLDEVMAFDYTTDASDLLASTDQLVVDTLGGGYPASCGVYAAIVHGIASLYSEEQYLAGQALYGTVYTARIACYYES